MTRRNRESPAPCGGSRRLICAGDETPSWTEREDYVRNASSSEMQPRRPRRQELAALLVDAVNERTFVTIDGRRRSITKREAIVTQMVDKSASADLRATKMLIDMMRDVEHKTGGAPPPEPRRLAAADKEVVQLFVARLRRQILQEQAKAAEPPG